MGIIFGEPKVAEVQPKVEEMAVEPVEESVAETPAAEEVGEAPVVEESPKPKTPRRTRKRK